MILFLIFIEVFEMLDRSVSLKCHCSEATMGCDLNGTCDANSTAQLYRNRYTEMQDWTPACVLVLPENLHLCFLSPNNATHGNFNSDVIVDHVLEFQKRLRCLDRITQMPGLMKNWSYCRNEDYCNTRSKVSNGSVQAKSAFKNISFSLFFYLNLVLGQYFVYFCVFPYK